MSAFGWIATGQRMNLTSLLRRIKPLARPRTNMRQARPGLESLESIDLMSAGGLKLPAAYTAKTQGVVAKTTVSVDSTIMATATQTTALQTATVGDTLTNFGALVPAPIGPLPPLSFQPNITLFNPSLGTLVAVHVTVTPTLTSTIVSQNISTTSSADISASLTNEKVQVNSIDAANTSYSDTLPDQTTGPVTVPPYSGEGTFQPPTTVNFPTLTATKTDTYNFTSAADLAYYTAGDGRTTITPGLSASAVAGASAPNGNLQSQVRTSGAGILTVTYDYTPPCPTLVSLVRYGIHHQPTQLQLTFNGPVDPTDAVNLSHYTVIVPNRSGSFTGPGTSTVPVTNAVYDPTTNSVTLTTARRLNVHYLFQLQVTLPCNNGNTVVVEFGGKNSLGGFLNHQGQFVKVVRGKVVK